MNENIKMTSVTVGNLFKNIHKEGFEKLLNDETKWVLSKGQRLYSWQEKQITDLIQDVDYIRELKREEQYLLQSITIAKEINENKIKVLDGQQRMTTLFLFKLALSIIKFNNIKKKTNITFNSKNDGPLTENTNGRGDNNAGYLEILDILLNNGDIKEFDYDAYIMVLNSESNIYNDKIEAHKNGLFEKFKEHIYRNKIKLNIFLEEDKGLFDKLTNKDEFIGFISEVSDKIMFDIEYYKGIIELFFLGNEEDTMVKSYLNNISKNLIHFIENLKSRPIEEIDDIIEIVDNNLVLGITYIGEPDTLVEVKSFTNINSRGLHLDFISQFKPWYFEQIITIYENNSVKFEQEDLEKTLSIVEETFEFIFAKFDNTVIDNKYSSIKSIYENFVNKSLIDAMNMWQVENKLLIITTSKEQVKVEKKTQPFNYKESWYNFLAKFNQNDLESETDKVENMFRNSFLDDILKTNGTGKIPEFMNLFLEMLNGRKKYLDILKNDIDKVHDAHANDKAAENKYFTKYDQRLMPIISLICSSNKDETAKKRSILNLLAYQTVKNFANKPIASYPTTQDIYRDFAELYKIRSTKWLKWEEISNNIDKKINEEIGRAFKHPDWDDNLKKHTKYQNNKLKAIDYCRLLHWLYSKDDDSKDLNDLINQEHELHHIIKKEIKDKLETNKNNGDSNLGLFFDKFESFESFVGMIQVVKKDINRETYENSKTADLSKILSNKMFISTYKSFITNDQEKDKEIVITFKEINDIFESALKGELKYDDEVERNLNHKIDTITKFKISELKKLFTEKLKYEFEKEGLTDVI